MENTVLDAVIEAFDPPLLPVDFDELAPEEHAARTTETTDSARLLAELESGGDPLDLVEATEAIAGEPGGDDGGGSFVRLQRINEFTTAWSDSVASSSPNRADAGDLERHGSSFLTPAPASDVIGPPPPPPNLFSWQTLEDTPLNGDVLAGATNDNGDPIVVTQFLVNGTMYNAGDTATITDTNRAPKWQNVGSLTLNADGTYTFIPSEDWNGTVPPVVVMMTDGSDTTIDNLTINVTPVSDAPSSAHTLLRAAAGHTYVLSANDFPVRNLKDSDVIDLADLPFSSPTAVTITALPPPGAVMYLDGVPVTEGTRVTAADLAAGKLVVQVDNSYRGGGMIPFKFQAEDGGSTDNGGVNESAEYMFRLNVSQVVTDNNYSNRRMFGGSGKDILVGDAGGVTQRSVDPNADLNIALLVDANAFETRSLGGQITKEQALKNALNNLLTDLSNHSGKVNVTLITFDASGSVNQISITDLDLLNVQFISGIINNLITGSNTSQADYTPAFNEAKAWFDLMANNYSGYENKTFFVTSSTPVGNFDDQAAAFDALKQLSEVHAIDMQHGNLGFNPEDKYRLDQYDTTGTQRIVADRNRYEVHSDFQNPAVAATQWDKSGTGNGSVQFGFNGVSNIMRIRSEDTADFVGNRHTIVTQNEANKMTVTDPDGAFFSFTVNQGRDRYFDMYSWRLLKWDATADNGQGAWIIAERGGDSLGSVLYDESTITTSQHPPGEYRFEFEVSGLGFYTNPGYIDIDNIRIHKIAYEGLPQYVKTANELNAALSISGTIVNSVGNDFITTTTVGDSIVFGDAINTDGLPWGQNGVPAKPADLHGTDALLYFLGAHLGHAPSHDEIFNYIWSNHRLFNVASDTHGGNDGIQGGAFNLLAFGGGGNDTIRTGIGGNNIMYGGAGNDNILIDGNSNNLAIGGAGNDLISVSAGVTRSSNTYAWLDGDAGTVASPALDRIVGFSLDRAASGGEGKDRLDLRDLLIGEENGDLTQYLNITFTGGNTVINVSTTGNLLANGTNFDQRITLNAVDITGGITDQQQLINDLISKGALLVDS